jgi:hypothetical protein
MNRFSIVVAGMLFAASCYGSPAQTSPVTIGHGSFPAALTQTLDSSKLKEGDAVELETVGAFKLPDGRLVSKGTKLEGHVVAAKARSKGDSESQLTIAFDKLKLTSEKELSLKGDVQAVFPRPDDQLDPSITGAATTASGGSMKGGAGGGDVGMITQPRQGSDMGSSTKPQPVMNTSAVGVQGIHDLSLENGVLTSKGKSVKLGRGLRMVIRAEIFGS